MRIRSNLSLEVIKRSKKVKNANRLKLVIFFGRVLFQGKSRGPKKPGGILSPLVPLRGPRWWCIRPWDGGGSRGGGGGWSNGTLRHSNWGRGILSYGRLRHSKLRWKSIIVFGVTWLNHIALLAQLSKAPTFPKLCGAKDNTASLHTHLWASVHETHPQGDVRKGLLVMLGHWGSPFFTSNAKEQICTTYRLA